MKSALWGRLWSVMPSSHSSSLSFSEVVKDSVGVIQSWAGSEEDHTPSVTRIGRVTSTAKNPLLPLTLSGVLFFHSKTVPPPRRQIQDLYISSFGWKDGGTDGHFAAHTAKLKLVLYQTIYQSPSKIAYDQEPKVQTLERFFSSRSPIGKRYVREREKEKEKKDLFETKGSQSRKKIEQIEGRI